MQKNKDEEEDEENDTKEEYYCREALSKERQMNFGTEMIEEKEIRFWCLLIGIKFIIAARPHVFMDGISYPTNKWME